jgi:hypothetical protein
VVASGGLGDVDSTLCHDDADGRAKAGPLVADVTGRPGGGPLAARRSTLALASGDLAVVLSVSALGDFGWLEPPAGFCVLDFLRGIDGRALVFPALAKIGSLWRPPLAVLLNAGLEDDSDVV